MRFDTLSFLNVDPAVALRLADLSAIQKCAAQIR
jgi:hypothetical protein